MRTWIWTIAAIILSNTSIAVAAEPTASGPHAYPEAVLHDFNPLVQTDGQTPMGPVTIDATGSLYGTTEYGGVYKCNGEACGTVFKLTRSGSQYFETLIHVFTGHVDGAYPVAGLLVGADGTLFGTTLNGGHGYQGCGCGTVFSLTPLWPGSQIYLKATIYNFYQNQNDGAAPMSGLIADQHGNLFGTTAYGGGGGCYSGNGCGSVYELLRMPSGYQEIVLHGFKGSGADGYYPTASLLMDAQGALYGTTDYGGDVSGCSCGAVFKLTPTASGYTETILHDFQGAPNDGGVPTAPLIVGNDGSLYGTTRLGGDGAGVRCGTLQTEGCGTVFRLVGSGSRYTERIIHDFDDSVAGWAPGGGLVMDKHGTLYGTTELGSACYLNACGTAFALQSDASGTYEMTVLHVFGHGSDGTKPITSMIIGGTGTLYGTTFEGGAYPDDGTVFRISI